MAMMKLNTTIGTVVDPTAGAQRALTNIGTIMKDASDIRAKKDALAQQATQDEEARKQREFANGLATASADRQQTTFDDQQHELARMLGVRKTTAELATGFGHHTVMGDALRSTITAAKERRYNELTKNGTVPLTGDQQAQFDGIYDSGFNPVKSKVSQYVSDYVLAHGGTLTEATNAANRLSEGYDTKKEILANESARVKSYNDAEKLRVENARYQLGLDKKIDIANGKGTSGKGGGYAYSGGDITKIRKNLEGIASGYGIKWDDTKARKVLKDLTSTGVMQPKEVEAYIASKLDPGVMGDNYDFASGIFTLDNKAIRKDAQGFINNLRKNSGHFGGTGRKTVAKLTDEQIARVTPHYVTGESLSQLLAKRNNYQSILDGIGAQSKKKVVAPTKTGGTGGGTGGGKHTKQIVEVPGTGDTTKTTVGGNGDVVKTIVDGNSDGVKTVTDATVVKPTKHTTNGDAVRSFIRNIGKGLTVTNSPSVINEKVESSRFVTKHSKDIKQLIGNYDKGDFRKSKSGNIPGSSQYSDKTLAEVLKDRYSTPQIEAMQSNPSLPYKLRKAIMESLKAN